MASSFDALGGGLDSEDESKKQERLAARAARFNKTLPGNKYKELEKLRSEELKVFVKQGLIKTGKTDLGDAVDMRGTCEGMCSGYEIEFREYTKEIHPFEAGPDKRMDHGKAVAAYTRSDAGAGMGDAAILPSDLRTPAALVRSLDYLITSILPKPPPAPSHIPNWQPTERKSLGYSAGFIRDRTRAIRKEFAMQSSWGHDESIETFERIARWHILCLRELQEESGMNKDMHIDSAELGRCFTSLRQHYNDRREELGIDLPYPNEPEFRAYMLLFDLTNKSVSIPTAELPSSILDHPLVQLAWELRKSAQRNFDSQKEGSKLNAELGSNIITSFVRSMKRPEMPYLLSCLCEIRLREMRRSALRALTRTYPRLKTEAVRVNEMGQIVERKMILIKDLVVILGCEEQEEEDSAWDGEDVVPFSKRPEEEAINIVKSFGFEIWSDESGPVGALINQGAPFNDNQDAPFTRRWKLVTAKKGGASYGDVINGNAGVNIGDKPASRVSRPTSVSLPPRPQAVRPTISQTGSAFSVPTTTPLASNSAFSFNAAAPTFAPALTSTPTTIPQSFSFAPPTDTVAKETFSFTSPVKPQAAVPPAPAPPTSTHIAPTLPSQAPIVQPKTIPSFFSSSAEAGPSKSTIPVVTPQPPKSPRQAPSTPPIQNSSNRARRKSLLSKSITAKEIEELRLAHERVLPILADAMIKSVISRYIGEITPDLTRTVKQESAARDYTSAKTHRQKVIDHYSSLTYTTILSDHIKRITRKAVFQEIIRRFLVRRCLRHWKTWARDQREMREEALRDREEIYGRLSGMGLGRSVRGGSVGDTSMSGVERFDMSSMGDRMDESEIDNALHQAERAKDQLFAPSTFLSTIARHVAPLLCPTSSPTTLSFPTSLKDYSPVSIVFHTLLSTSKDSSTPPDKAAQDWLRSKLAIGDGDELTVDGVTVASDFTGRYDALPISTYWGLIVFEVPLKSWNNHSRTENIADAQDRMVGFAKTLGHGNRYRPALLFLTWEDESIEEVIERLQIAEDVSMFNKVGIVSLEESEDIDTRFQQAVEKVLPSIEEKSQVVIRIQDVLSKVQYAWQRFIQTAQLVLNQTPGDSRLIAEVFNSGISILQDIPMIIKKCLGSLQPSIASTFNPIKLPSFNLNHKSDGDILSVVEEVVDYLDYEIFLGLDDLALFTAPLHQAALHNRGVSKEVQKLILIPVPPLPQILQAIAFFALGEIRKQTIPLKVWRQNPIEAREVYNTYLEKVSETLERQVDDRIEILSRLSMEATGFSEDGDKENVFSGPSASQSSPNVKSEIKSSSSLKRVRSSDASEIPVIEEVKTRKIESKALKHAKLLKAMEKARRALEKVR